MRGVTSGDRFDRLASVVGPDAAVTVRDGFAASLDHLAAGGNRALARGVASHPHANAGTLTTLAADHDPTVRAAVAANPRTPAGTLDTLATDPDVTVRAAVTANPSAPEHVRAAAALS